MRIFATLATVVVAWAAARAAAQDQWLIGGSSVFSDNINWLDGSAPTPSDKVEFTPGAYTVTFTADATTDDVQVKSGTVLFQSAGGPFTYSVEGVGQGQNGSLSVEGSVLTLGSIGGPLNMSPEQLFVDAGAVLNVFHGSELTQGGATAGNVTSTNGPSFDVGGDVNAGDNGVAYATQLQIQAGGHVHVGSTGTGTLNIANGPSPVNGFIGGGVVAGTLTVEPGSTFWSPAFKIDPGGLVELGNDFTTTIWTGQHLDIRGTLRMTDGASLNIDGTPNDGFNLRDLFGTLQVSGDLNIGAAGTTVQWRATGAEIEVTGTTNFGGGGPAGVPEFTFDNGTTAVLDTLNIGASTTSEGGATVTVSGSSVDAGDINIGSGDFGSGSSFGTLRITGGSVTQDGAAVTTVGGATSSFGRLEVVGGFFSAGGGGTVLNALGRIVVNGGVADLGDLTQNGGKIEFTAGDLSLIGDISIGEDSVLGTENLELVDHDLLVEGTVTIDPYAAIVFSGGYAEASAMVVDGSLLLNDGALFISDGDLVVGDQALSATVELGAGRPVLLSVAEETMIEAGSQLVMRGGRLDSTDLTVNGAANVLGGAVNLAGAATVGAGGALAFTGGVLTADSLDNSGLASFSGASAIVANGLNNQPGGLVVVGSTGVATIDGASVNSGTVLLSGGAAQLRGGDALTNNGLVRGDGTIFKGVTNAATGEIRASAGQTLRLEGANGANSGRINLQGGTVEFLQPLSNAAGGLITGRGALSVGGSGLTNQGAMAFSAGVSDVFGDVANAAGASIVASGGANVNFWDDVIHNGVEIRVAQGASAVFFGDVTGAGPFTGTGQVFFEGDLSPGNSPAEVSFGGDVSFGSFSSLTIEIGGVAASSEFDVASIDGVASLDGALLVELIDLGSGLFSPDAGDSFEIVTAGGGVIGTFSSVSLPMLGGDLFWEVHYESAAVLLEVAAASADFDDDGDVDGADFLSWQRGLGITSGGAISDGDADADGDVDAADLAVWRNQFGDVAVSTPGAANVPEPAAFIVAASSLVGLSLVRRRNVRLQRLK